jgi:hypothetical protein
VIISKTLRKEGHVQRKGKARNACEVLVGKIERRVLLIGYSFSW